MIESQWLQERKNIDVEVAQFEDHRHEIGSRTVSLALTAL
jgi:hypothetical protein